MLYEISTKDSKRINYLFGTIHLGGRDVDIIAEKVKLYINRVNHFYGEMDITQIIEGFEETFKLPSNLTLSDLFPYKKLTKLNAFSIKYFGLDLMSMYQVKPLFIISRLGEIIANHEGKTLDPILFDYALSRNIQIGGLESMQKQMEIANSIPLNIQAKMLADALQNIKKFKKNFKNQVIDYHLFRVIPLYKKSKKNLGGLRNLMLYERNCEISKKIHEIIGEKKNDSIFFCFGAAHLGGGKGVIAHLKKLGYNVKLDTNWKSKPNNIKPKNLKSKSLHLDEYN